MRVFKIRYKQRDVAIEFPNTADGAIRFFMDKEYSYNVSSKLAIWAGPGDARFNMMQSGNRRPPHPINVTKFIQC